MDSIPPSYLQATTRDHWEIISSFVASPDLCSAALVSQKWNRIFAPHLWGNPASHFGTENDAVYVALVRFKRTLSFARRSTRELTHTLRLPPAHAELYDGPRAEWLRDILLRLPRLQSLIVSGLPFFDHGALTNLPIKQGALSRATGNDHNSFSLRMLEASNCFNATSSGLATALRCFPSLTYLDLSNTAPARDPYVLAALRLLTGLQILKLRNLSLRDEDLTIVSRAIGLKVRSLDVRNNKLSNDAVRKLLQNNVVTPSQASEIYNANIRSNGMTPSMQAYFGTGLPAVYNTDYQDKLVYQRLTSGFFQHVGIEDACGTGLTHLYISGNQISVTAAADILQMNRLVVLDIGTLVEDPSISSPREKKAISPIAFVGPESLIRILDHKGKDITYLRLDHDIVTKLIDNVAGSVAELDSTPPEQENASQAEVTMQRVSELEGDPTPAQELPADDLVVFELEGSPVVSPRNSTVPRRSIIEKRPENLESVRPRISIRSEPHEAPEVSPFSPCTPLLSPFQPPSTALSSRSPSPAESLQPPKEGPSRPRTYSGVLADHEDRVAFRKSQPHGLLPSMVPSLTTLALTNIPTHAPTMDIARNIITFITLCAEEAHWSRIRARHAYALPPGRDRAAAEKAYAQSLFGLKRLVLEMKATKLNKDGTIYAQPRNKGKSSVEDDDCEVFWRAAKDDFSFFTDEECGQPETDIKRPIPLEVRMGKMVVGEQAPSYESVVKSGRASGGPAPPQAVDVLAEVSRFRRDKKSAYELALRRGESDPYVAGFWEGEIVVLRPAE